MSTAAQWIQPQHLDEVAIAGYRRSFEAHPSRAVVIDDFLVDEKAEHLRKFLELDADYEVKFGLHSREGDVITEQEWEHAPDEDRFFRFSQLLRVKPDAMLSPHTLAYMRFRAVFAEEDVRGLFESVTGMALDYTSEDVGVHAMHEGDFLRSHDDNDRGRQLAMILYFSPDWKEEYGGQLNIVGVDGDVTEVVPRYNTLAMFDVLTGATHHVARVTEASGGSPRWTIGGWYHAPGGPT